MDIKKAMKYVSMRNFLPDFCGIEYTAMTLHKMRGIDGNKKKISFTKKEKAKIEKGRIALNKYLASVLKSE